ncbi:glycosyltransferase family 4 protein [Azospirillum sp. SYSU D00513]|uniref:glycosyltransferase family 4 protein n=1 Tax=Azospirillum sp. SYSU D00513 TaxID=2812561 RepID=UPI001A964DA0|nr:glycosyltransferase family 4 protein [Azospirillum sp. SYSU D00513]
MNVDAPRRLRILQVHNRYQKHGGEDNVCEAERLLLQSNACDVVTYTETNERIAGTGRISAALNATWSRASYARVRKILRESRFDLVHVHNFFPLVSPSVHHAARAEGVATVQTLHNYRLFCAGATMVRDGAVCESCIGRHIPWPAIRHRCYRGSTAGSAAVAAMQVAHRWLGSWSRTTSAFIALSEFSRRKFIEFGLPAEKLLVKPNFLTTTPPVGEGRGGYALFVGRLSPEKGIATLLDAWRHLGGSLPLRVIGEGPEAPAVRAALAGSPGISWLGQRSSQEVARQMAGASVLLFPSEWYEGCPLVLLEAFAAGTPVIASRIGSAAEMVEEGRTGLFFQPGNAAGLAAKVAWCFDNPHHLLAMRAQVRASFEARYTAERNWTQLLSVYDRAMAASRQ